MPDEPSAHGGRVSHTIIEQVATAKGVASRDLAPLYDAIDPDALNALCQDGFDGRVEFQYANHVVVVDDSEVRIESSGHRPETDPTADSDDSRSSS